MKPTFTTTPARQTSFEEAISGSEEILQMHPRAASLPGGVILRPLGTHHDERGSLTELFRTSWETGVNAVQWNYVESEGAVLRGVHVHIKHGDYLILLRGRATIGLRDLRPDSATAGLTALIDMQGNDPQALTIPPGVAHGFYFHEPCVHIYGVSEFWDPQDELGCHWADPALEIKWPTTAPVISPRDAALPSLNDLVESLRHVRYS